jgi:PII-like signaling protein
MVSPAFTRSRRTGSKGAAVLAGPNGFGGSSDGVAWLAVGIP